MPGAELLKANCQKCGVLLEFSPEVAGSTVACPSCSDLTALGVREEKQPAPSLEELMGAFQGAMQVPRPGFRYSLGLAFAAVVMISMALVYSSLVLLVGYGLLKWVLLLPRFLGALGALGIWLLIFSIVLVLLLFLIKPLFAPKARHIQPLALSPEAEPLLFALVERICQTVGSPTPRRIDVDCEINASAGFRRGFLSFLGNDLVLTIGLPLAAGTTISQLAGVLAHEFGHFRQGAGLRMYYVVRRIDIWFLRLIYERDQWDHWLEEKADSPETSADLVLATFARTGIGLSRLILRVLHLIGVAASSYLSRQMEYDADACEVQLAGSKVFEETALLLATLHEADHLAFKRVRVSWENSNALPDDWPKLIRIQHGQLPALKRSAIHDRAGLESTGFFSTHPASGDRIRQARQAEAPGVFGWNSPASDLFSNFEILSRQVTILHYTDELGLPLPLIQFRPTEDYFKGESGISGTLETRSNKPEPRRLKLNSR